jgi:hypothetical protein
MKNNAGNAAGCCDATSPKPNARTGPAVSSQPASDTDPAEREYRHAINVAVAAGDNDRAQELATGLRQYREYYKT